jgi:hypothetical protein
MRIVCVLLLLVSLPGLAWADDVICEDTITVGKYRRYQASIDLTTVAVQPNEQCHPIAEAQLAAQRAACYDGNVPPPTIPVKYRKVVGGLCAEMSQQEKNQVDAVEQANQAQQQAYAQERGGPQCGEKQLGQLTSKLNQMKGEKITALEAAHTAIDQTIDALTTWDVTIAKTTLKQLTADFYTQMNADVDDEYKWFNEIYRCLRAQVGLR